MPDQNLVTIDELLGNVVAETNLDAVAVGLTDSIVLDPAIKRYRITLGLDEENAAVLPVPANTAIPVKQAYFDYELEITVPAEAETFTFNTPSSWTWLPGGELPMLLEDFAGKVLYVSARFDCQSRKTLANTWRIENAN